MNFRYVLLIFIMCMSQGLFIPHALNAMKPHQHIIKVDCDIQKNAHSDGGPSLITFSGSFLRHLHKAYHIRKTLALRCSVTRHPTITVNTLTKSLTIECAFKDVATQEPINVKEDISWASQTTVERRLSDDWRIIITTTLPPDDADR